MAVTGVLLIAGMLLLSSPGGMVFLAWSAWRRHRRISSIIPTMTCGQLSAQLAGGEQLPRWVAVHGRTVQDSRLLLRAPRSGAECVWYQVEYAFSPNHDERLRRWVEFHPGAELVAITDGTGTVFLTPQLARTTLSGPPIATVTGAGQDGDTRWQEAVIPPGVPVFVIGRTTRSSALDHVPTAIVETGPWSLTSSFPMSTAARPSSEQDGVVLETGWRTPQGVTTVPAEQIRRAFAARRNWAVLLLLALPVLGAGLIGLAGVFATRSG